MFIDLRPDFHDTKRAAEIDDNAGPFPRPRMQRRLDLSNLNRVMRSLPHITVACGSIWAGSRLLASKKHGRKLANGTGIGSLLPDLVDRAQRTAFRVRRSSPDQHFLGHTLLLNLPLLFAGMYFWRRRRDARLLSMSGAAMTHLLVDPVIRSPGTLLWPLFGLEFPGAPGLSPRLTALTQIAAATAVVLTIFGLQRQKRLRELLSSGRL
ncbi:MAG: hypothetical protein E6J43_03930 [Chloroflexi bacterium]|nr:MAG: hypothetical protein E6J43_03930 [Chloroflexota bacterium]